MAYNYPLSEYWRTFVEEGVNMGSYNAPLTTRQILKQWLNCFTDISHPFHVVRYLFGVIAAMWVYQIVAFASATLPVLSLEIALKVVAGVLLLTIGAIFAMGSWIEYHSKKAILLDEHILQEAMPFIVFYVLKLDFLNWIKHPSFWANLPYVAYTLAKDIRAGAVSVFGNTEDNCSMGVVLTNRRYPTLSEQLQEQVGINRKAAGIYSLYVPEDMFTMHQGDKTHLDINVPSCILIHFLSKMIDTLQIRHLETAIHINSPAKWPERECMFHHLVWWAGSQGTQFTPWLEEAYAELEPLFQQFQKEQDNKDSDVLSTVQAFLRYFSEKSFAWKQLSLHSSLSTYS